MNLSLIVDKFLFTHDLFVLEEKEKLHIAAVNLLRIH